MKKFLPVVIASGLCLFAVANVHAAGSMKGENLCQTIVDGLRTNGYSKGAVMTGDGIKEMLNRSNVTLDTLTLLPSERYAVNYSCELDHGVAHAELITTPVNGNIESRVNQIKWSATKPVSR